MALDIDAIRADFPILDRVLPNGKKLVILTTPLPLKNLKLLSIR